MAGAGAKIMERIAEPVTEAEPVVRLLGGAKTLRRRISTALDAHEVIERGMPAEALHHLVESMQVLDFETSVVKGIGVSLRTFQRSKVHPERALSVDAGGRTWKLAEILAKATEVFGSRPAAERWLESAAVGLNQYRPIDLLATPAGTELVDDYLGRIEYGVYT